MSFLVVLKRFEVWLLFAVVVGVFWIAFLPEPSDPESPGSTPVAVTKMPDDTSPDPVAEAPTPLTVREVRVLPSGGGKIVETILSGRSPSGEDITLDGDTVRATDSKGETVPRFFEPFRGAGLIAGSADSEATLRWWLTSPTDEIWLEVSGLRLRAGLATAPQ